MDRTDLHNLTYRQLEDYCAALNIPSSRARQIFPWLYTLGPKNFAELPLKKEFRAALADHAQVSNFTPFEVELSKDGTTKYSFRLTDGAMIESVLIPANERHTLCVSSQAGCAMDCQFCLTGHQGLHRNLRPAEIVNQVIAVMEHMVASGVKRLPVRELINNLVFMGMGEPLANYDNLIAALNILMDEKGFEFTERRITVSTCGIVPKIKALGRDVRVHLAISLHAADDETRSLLMPINKTYGIDELLAACRDFPLSKKKVILFEYTLIEGINNSITDAKLLAKKLKGIPSRINLLPYNESEALPYSCPTAEKIEVFQKVLRDAGYRTLIRTSRGSDISAACGQLATGSRYSK